MRSCTLELNVLHSSVRSGNVFLPPSRPNHGKQSRALLAAGSGWRPGIFLVFACVAVFTSPVSAAIPSGDGTITSCRKGESIRLIDTEAGETCKQSEQVLTWSQVGPPGPDGQDGQDGLPGSKGDPGPASLDALVGTECLFDETVPGIVDVVIEPETGLVSILCVPTAAVAQDGSLTKLVRILACPPEQFLAGNNVGCLVGSSVPGFTSTIHLTAKQYENQSATLAVTQPPIDGTLITAPPVFCGEGYCDLLGSWTPCDSSSFCVGADRWIGFSATDGFNGIVTAGSVRIAFQYEFVPLEWEWDAGGTCPDGTVRVIQASPIAAGGRYGLVYDALAQCVEDAASLNPDKATRLDIDNAVANLGLEFVVEELVQPFDENGDGILDVLGCDDIYLIDFAQELIAAFEEGRAPIYCSGQPLTLVPNGISGKAFLVATGVGADLNQHFIHALSQMTQQH